MPDFGAVDLVSEEARAEQILALARQLSPDTVIVAGQGRHPAMDMLLSRLRRLPREVVVVAVGRPGAGLWCIESKAPNRYFQEDITPLLLRRQQVLMLGATLLLRNMVDTIDPEGLEISEYPGRVRVAFKRHFHPHPGNEHSGGVPAR